MTTPALTPAEVIALTLANTGLLPMRHTHSAVETTPTRDAGAAERAAYRQHRFDTLALPRIGGPR